MYVHALPGVLYLRRKSISFLKLDFPGAPGYKERTRDNGSAFGKDTRISSGRTSGSGQHTERHALPFSPRLDSRP